jgi:CheY-like chemotaxis protein
MFSRGQGFGVNNLLSYFVAQLQALSWNLGHNRPLVFPSVMGAQRSARFASAKHHLWGALIATRPLVGVVDDDESVRESLPDLLGELGYAAETYSSAEAFLASDRIAQTKCLILDVALPGMSGPDLQDALSRGRRAIPIIFITAHGNEADRAKLLRSGAVDCLLKPFSDIALGFALDKALRAE